MNQKEFNSVVILMLTELKKDASVILTPEKLKRYDLYLTAMEQINEGIKT